MILLKLRTSSVTIMDGKRTLYRKLSPSYGGVAAEQLLRALNIDRTSVGNYVLRFVDYQSAVATIDELNSLDLKRYGGPQVIADKVSALQTLLLEVERL